MMKKLMIAVVLFAAACKQTNEEHLPVKKMEEVLLDVNIAEAYSSMNRDKTHVNGMKNMDSLAVYYNGIFARHHITYDQFMTSLNWYKKHETDLDTVYTHILVKVEQLVTAENKKTQH
jgi:hypothetical protein